MAKSSNPARPNTWAFSVALSWVILLLAGHFLAMGWFAHWIGTPLSLPSWLGGINRMFRYGFSSGLDIIIEAVWIIILAATVVGTFYLHSLPSVLWPAAEPGRETPGDAFVRAFCASLPLGILLWLLLAILPLQSHNLPQSSTELDTLHALSWDDSLFELTQGILAFLFICALFVGIFLGISFFQRFMPKVRDGCGWQLIVAILFGIVLMLAVGLPSGPLLQQLHDARGSKVAFWMVYGVAVILLIPPGLRMSRFEPKKVEVEKTASDSEKKIKEMWRGE